MGWLEALLCIIHDLGPKLKAATIWIIASNCAKGKRALEGLMLEIKCSSPEVIPFAFHNWWAITNHVALSSYQEARVSYPAMYPELEKQKHLVNSPQEYHRTVGRVVGWWEPCALSNRSRKQVCITWGGLCIDSWYPAPWNRTRTILGDLTAHSWHHGWKPQVEIM